MENSNKKLRFGVPKGSLQESTLNIFKQAGFDIDVPERGYLLKIDDPEIELFLIRPQEIPKYIERNKLDGGISGKDWILETKARVVEVCDLKYAKQEIKEVRWVLAVHPNSRIKTIQDLEGKIISTELVNVTKTYLKKHKIKARVEFSFGATEVKPPLFADAIVDLIETGKSLRAHNLEILDTVLVSSTKLIANSKSWKDNWRKEKIQDLALLLQGVVSGVGEVNLIMHVPEEKLKLVFKLLSKSTTVDVRKVVGMDYFDISFNCRVIETRDLIPNLKKIGCEDIVEYPTSLIVK